MAWTVYDAKDSGPQFVALPRAGSVREFLDTTSAYQAPAQNMIVADQAGAIAIRSTGRYPIRPGDGRGDRIQDGRTRAADWIGSLPIDAYPQAIDPPRGFLSSANQQPVDPLVNPRYLGANWYSPWRALRINALLRSDSTVTVDAMRRFQTDPGSARADAFVPLLLGGATDSARVHRAPPPVAEARRLLAEWDRRYDRDNRRAVLFELAMAELGRLTWDELAGPDTASAESPIRPTEAILLELMQDSANVWWDRRSTASVVEHRDDIIELALSQALTLAKAKHGDPAGAGWRWGSVHTGNIYHVLRIPALSALGLEVDGGPSTLSPSSGSGTDGPSWRMVVELGPDVVGWGTYPGGQSGNPASAHYLDQLPNWLAGRLDSLVVPATADGMPAARVESRLRFEARR
jgi:penicillin amidase